MIKNYIKIAWRNLIKDKSYTFINVFGLTLAIVSCICMILYVNHQLGYDTHHQQTEQLYRLKTNIEASEGRNEFTSSGASPAIAFGIKDALPEVEDACRVVYMMDENGSYLKASQSDVGFFESRGYLADSTFFSFFNYKFVAGNPDKALHEPNSMVLSSELSKKLFGTDSPINQTVQMDEGDNAQTYTIKGVFDETFGKSHLRPNYIMSMNSPGLGAFVRNNQQWATQNFTFSYLKLNASIDPIFLEKKINEQLQKNAGPVLQRMGMKKTLSLQKVKDIHLYSKGISNQISTVSDIRYLILLLSLAAFIIGVASINFILLSTARANKRSREIGVRKVMGANKGELVTQFLGESLVLSFLSTALSLPIVSILIPYLNRLTDSEILLSDLMQPSMLLITLGIGCVTGLLSGIYPALYLSSLNTITSLKNVQSLKGGSGYLRKSLVIIQFIISIFLIVAAITFAAQIKFTNEKDLGFKRNNRIAVELGTQNSRENYFALRNEISNISGVLGVTGCNSNPAERMLSDFGAHLPGQDPSTRILVRSNSVTEDFFENIGTPIIAGRSLKSTDTANQIVVSETVLDRFGIELDNAISSILIMPWEGVITELEIVGVHKDYHYESLRDPIQPLVTSYTQYPNSILIRTDGEKYDQKLAAIESAWKKILPSTPFSYSFLDEDLQKYYAQEKSQSALSYLFTLLAILISCLGLFGLVTFTAEQRKKEIGVRKVLGSSVSGIVKLLSKEFIYLIGFSFLIAIPISWYFMQKWLQSFEYRIELSWWMFALAGLIALIIAFSTVSIQAIRAASANPINSLKTE